MNAAFDKRFESQYLDYGDWSNFEESLQLVKMCRQHKA